MKPTRRDFLKSASVLSAGAFFIPNLISCSPSNRLNIAVIGVGGQGKSNWSKMINQKDSKWNENIVALCDVDDNRAADGYRVMPNGSCSIRCIKKLMRSWFVHLIIHISRLSWQPCSWVSM